MSCRRPEDRPSRPTTYEVQNQSEYVGDRVAADCRAAVRRDVGVGSGSRGATATARAFSLSVRANAAIVQLSSDATSERLDQFGQAYGAGLSEKAIVVAVVGYMRR